LLKGDEYVNNDAHYSKPRVYQNERPQYRTYSPPVHRNDKPQNNIYSRHVQSIQNKPKERIQIKKKPTMNAVNTTGNRRRTQPLPKSHEKPNKSQPVIVNHLFLIH
jgi:hypothetical protein